MSSGASELPSLPSGWKASPAALGGVDLRLEARGRRSLIVVLLILALVAAWRTFVNGQISRGGSFAPWLGITLILSLLALWCGFADEHWHIERNLLAHRIGVGSWAHSRQYRNADLQIMVRFTKKARSRPYYRLYAIENGKSHFLVERFDEQELRQLETFISFHTGWPIQPLVSPSLGLVRLL